ncbi:MAG: hypothetical protein KKG09_09475 [Verrucomicrobia bacterium]|nr:hypothetical protein [Verrucomicrobiota bacterium]MBU4247096.1 hypothetical protein [Verrucomicrobiota bacterium]MBU4290244.1 hypothetical protein [Verrucomicrobiota bacterium]MBU4498219.1 hypothetical protein [Verrucomicrobiota bacterium]MCG2679961.1 hypothetical protein [Kiritimatiellia bacterium]
MDDPSHSEVVHLQVDKHLPALPASVPAVEILKQILEQMLENERRRVRNEFIRISVLFLVLLLLIMGGGFWIARDILIQVKEARLMSEHSQDALTTFLAAANRNGPNAPFLPSLTVTREKPANRAAYPAEIQNTIADLEENNKSLSELMQTQNADLNNLVMDVLKSRKNELQELSSKINAKQSRVIAAEPVDLDALSRPSAPVSSQKVSIPDRPLVKSLTAPVAADLPLRLPIPRP